MKKLYWRPPGVSRRALVLIALVAFAGLVLVESFPVERKQLAYNQKLAAAALARDCMSAIRDEKQRRNIPVDPQFDPAGTGMVGVSISRVTSNVGTYTAKLTTTNPNFAAVIVHWLKQINIKEGDSVAVGVSGSFPALNVATYSAIQTLKLKPVVIASASSSGWGANNEGFLWLDMETTLRERQLIEFGAVAASRGSIDDRGVGMSNEGLAMLDEAIQRNGVEHLNPASLAESIDKRMQVFDKHSKRYKAYINVGGGSASVGTHVGKKKFKPGLNRSVPRGEVPDSVMLRFAQRDLPVLHLSGIKDLSSRYDLQEKPTSPVPLGESNVFRRSEYNPWLAGGSLGVIVLAMLAFIRLDLGARLLSAKRADESKRQPEPMI